MLATALSIVAAAAAALTAGVVTGELRLVYAAMWLCGVGAVLLAVGVARYRPGRHPSLADGPAWSAAPEATTWPDTAEAAGGASWPVGSAGTDADVPGGDTDAAGSSPEGGDERPT